MGKADLPYARSVQQTHPLPHNMLPDAGLVFDSLLKRKKVETLVILIFTITLTGTGLVCQASGGTVQHDVLIRGACHPHVSLIFSFQFHIEYVPIYFSESVFRTSHDNVNINETSSYVDLAPLYGNNKETLDKIRVLDGRGLLKPDTFAEDRLLLLPPAVCVLLVLFNRNHNVRSRSCDDVSSFIDPHV
jgi:linoleate 10R-lipoxygenase